MKAMSKSLKKGESHPKSSERNLQSELTQKREKTPSSKSSQEKKVIKPSAQRKNISKKE